MKAAVYRRYGPPEVVRIEEVPTPTPEPHEVRMRVCATTVGTWDAEARAFSFPLWFGIPLRLAMGLRTPRWPILGQEAAGVVDAVGSEVTNFAAGDRVCASLGLGFGGHAEFACVSSRGAIAHIPPNLEFAEATTLPVGGDNALHFLRMADVQPGERVLVNGAGGNIGVLAVQLAKHFGAEVTAVDAGPKLERLRKIGADHALDYTSEDFAAAGPRYDVIFDLVFGSSYARALSALTSRGRYLLANASLPSLLRSHWTNATRTQRVRSRFAASRPADLETLVELAGSGAIRGVIDRRFPFEEAAAAHCYVDGGSRTGAVVLDLAGPEASGGRGGS
ncbi:MAG: NAD(P)-dependent alcohol dehydrogenase [Myxococcota bacterium]